MVINNLKKIRTERGMSKSELSRRTGISRITITEIETEVGNPQLRTCLLIARALGKTLDEIFYNVEEPEEVVLMR